MIRPTPGTAKGVDLSVLRVRFTPGKGEVYGPPGAIAGPASPLPPGGVLPRLNGRKHLVTGNNDEPAVCALNWSSVQAYTELIVDGVMLVLCHYPFRTWNRIDRGSINLHGHSHGRLKPLTRQFDVGVDAHDFQPISLRELLVSRRVTDSRTQ